MNHFHVKEGFIEGCFINLYDQIGLLGLNNFKNSISNNKDFFVSLAQKGE